MIESLESLMRHYGVNTPEQLAREFYDETPCGVSTAFIRLYPSGETETIYSDHPWLNSHHSIVAIKFSQIVEGSDAEFSADPIYFPLTLEEIQEAYDYLEAESDAVVAEEGLEW